MGKPKTSKEMEKMKGIFWTSVVLFVLIFYSYSSSQMHKPMLFLSVTADTKAAFFDDFGMSGYLGFIYKNIDLSVCVDIYQSKSRRYTINSFENDLSALSWGGLYFHYRSFLGKKYAFVYPGIMAGFWRCNRYHFARSESGKLPGNYDRYTMLIAGPTLIAKLGYKRIFVTLEDSFLIGNNCWNLIKIGKR